MTDERVGEHMLDAYISCNINWLIVVPGSGLNFVYQAYAQRGRCLYVTREEEGIAIATGLALGGERPLVLIQQSGVGNALNAVFSLSDAYHIYFPIVVCDRSGDDPNPVQKVSSYETNLVLKSLHSSFIEWDGVNSTNIFKNLVEEQKRWIVCSIVGKR